MILFDEPVGICSKGGKNMDDRMEREKIVRNFFFSRFFRLKKKKKKKEIDESRRKFLETMFLQWVDWIGVM